VFVNEQNKVASRRDITRIAWRFQRRVHRMCDRGVPQGTIEVPVWLRPSGIILNRPFGTPGLLRRQPGVENAGLLSVLPSGALEFARSERRAVSKLAAFDGQKAVIDPILKEIPIQVGSVALRRPGPRPAGRTIARLDGARTPQRGVPTWKLPDRCYRTVASRGALAVGAAYDRSPLPSGAVSGCSALSEIRC
jgi:hypothetical protein